MPSKKTVVLGFVGTKLDAGGRRRWQRWRPTVDLHRRSDFVVDRTVLLFDPRWSRLAKSITTDIAEISPETEVDDRKLELPDPWDFEDVYARMHDFTAAYPWDPENEEYFVHITTGSHVVQICWFLLTESRRIPGKLLQTSPSRGIPQEEPCSIDVIDLDLSRYDRIASRFEREHVEGLSFLKSGIATRNGPFNELIERIERVSIASPAPILLQGPTGAGKSQLARRIYELKRRRDRVKGAFVEVNCATVRGDGAMSALFGHVKGAFTGAQRDRPGLLRAADQGVLFLDEIAELGLDEQAMLLRALEERTFLPVGCDREVQSAFQLIAGTNQDLRDQVAAGRFRDDLLARINLWTFELPGLADRREDIEPNLEFELERAEQENGRQARFNKEARTAYLTFAQAPDARWLGNFRDLNASITRLATLAGGGRITLDLVRAETAQLLASWRRQSPDPQRATLVPVMGEEAFAALDRFDRVQLAEVVRVVLRTRNLSAAGRELFAASRTRRKSVNDADRVRKYLARFGVLEALR